MAFKISIPKKDMLHLGPKIFKVKHGQVRQLRSGVAAEVRCGQLMSGMVRRGQVWSGKIKEGQLRPGVVRQDQGGSAKVRCGQARSRRVS